MAESTLPSHHQSPWVPCRCTPCLRPHRPTTAGNGLSFSTFVNTVPISEGRTVNRFALIRNLELPVLMGLTSAVFNAGAWDKLAHDAMIKCAADAMKRQS